MAVLHQTMCTSFCKGTDRFDEIRIVDRYAKTRSAVRDILDICSTAKGFKEYLRFDVAFVDLHALAFQSFLCFIVSLRIELILGILIRTARSLIVVFENEITEYEEIDYREAAANHDLRDIGAGVIFEKRDPVLHERIDEAAAEGADNTKDIKRCSKGCCEESMHCEEERCNEQEGEFQRLCDTTKHCRDGCRNQETCYRTAFLRFSRNVHGSRNTRDTKHLGGTMQGEACTREHVFQGMSTRCEILQMLEPVLLDTAIDDCRSKDERRVNEMMQTSRNEDTFAERVDPDADKVTGFQEALEACDGMLYFRPYDAEYECHWDHEEEACSNNEG